MEEQNVDKVYEELIARSNEFYDGGDYERAVEACDDAIKFDPKQGFAWYSKGLALFKMEKYEDALSAFDKALSLDPNILEPYLGKAYVLMKLFRFEDAVEVLKEAYLKGEAAEVACLLGLCYAFLEKEDDAALWFKRAFEKDKDYTVKFFDDAYSEIVIKDGNITADEKIAIKTAIDRLKKKMLSK